MDCERRDRKLTCDKSFEQQDFILFVVFQHPLKVFLFPLDGHLTTQFRFRPAALSCSRLRSCRGRESVSMSHLTHTTCVHSADVNSCWYLLTPELSSCRSWAVSSASSHSSPVSPPAPWGPNKWKINQHDWSDVLKCVCFVQQQNFSPGCRWWAVWSPAVRCTPP